MAFSSSVAVTGDGGCWAMGTWVRCIICCQRWHRGARACVFGLAFVRSAAGLRLVVGAGVPAPLLTRVSMPVRLAFWHPGSAAGGGILSCRASSRFALLGRWVGQSRRTRMSGFTSVRCYGLAGKLLWDRDLTLCCVQRNISDICHPQSLLAIYLSSVRQLSCL